MPPLQTYLGQNELSLMVSGFTDDTTLRPNGSFTDNWEVSAQRSLTVTRELVEAGMPADWIFAAGFGANHPVAPNDTEEHRAMNRRVEISPVPRLIHRIGNPTDGSAAADPSESAAAPLVVVPATGAAEQGSTPTAVTATPGCGTTPKAHGARSGGRWACFTDSADYRGGRRDCDRRGGWWCVLLEVHARITRAFRGLCAGDVRRGACGHDAGTNEAGADGTRTNRARADGGGSLAARATGFRVVTRGNADNCCNDDGST